MAQYQYECTSTGDETTRFLSISNMDAPQTCECGVPLTRVEIPTEHTVDTKGAYHFAFDYGEGRMVKGHLRKTAKMKGPSYYKP